MGSLRASIHGGGPPWVCVTKAPSRKTVNLRPRQGSEPCDGDVFSEDPLYMNEMGATPDQHDTSATPHCGVQTSAAPFGAGRASFPGFEEKDGRKRA